MARAWHLASRPSAMPTHDHFVLKDYAPPALTEGTIRVRNRWLSVDPYMRGRMSRAAGHFPAFALDAPLEGGAVGEVIESRAEGFAPGDMVAHMLGWRDEAVLAAATAEKIAHDGAEQAYLGVLGLTGATAYFALTKVAEITQGQTLFVSAAAGAVGSTVVQIARLKGLRVIASAGGVDKAAWLRKIGADAVIDYKAGPLLDQLRDAAPEGIDVYFDNVGGDHLDAAIAVANNHARFVLCGMIGSYNSDEPIRLHFMIRAIEARIRMEGFSLEDYFDQFPAFRREMGEWMRQGLLVPTDTVREGLEAVPDAFLSLFSGGNRGKMVVRL